MDNEQKAAAEALAARGEELDRREAALKVQQDDFEEASRTLAANIQTAAERKDELDRRSANIARAEADAARNAVEDLPDGVSVAVIQLDPDIVAVLATLHPSEQGSIAARVNGAVREALIETRKLRPRSYAQPPAAIPATPADLPPTYAEVIPGRAATLT